jgi:hypothetical protein
MRKPSIFIKSAKKIFRTGKIDDFIDELLYESENLRRTINQKQDEVAGLNRMLNQQALTQDQSNEKIR